MVSHNDDDKVVPLNKVSRPSQRRIRHSHPFFNKLSLQKLRVYAFFTDLLFIGFIHKFILLTYVNFVNELFYQLPILVRTKLFNDMFSLKLSTLILTFFSYFLCSLYFGRGKTPGKTIFALCVVPKNKELEEISFFMVLKRTIGYSACYISAFYNPFLPIVLFSFPLFMKNGIGIPDFLSQTKVMTDASIDDLKSELICQNNEEILNKDTSEQMDLFKTDF